MKYSDAVIAGSLIFIAATQFALLLITAETRFPGYNVSTNYISDLGIGSSSLIFNSSVFIMGLLILIGSVFLQRAFNCKVLTVLLILTSIGTMGVGIFTENSGSVHPIVSLIAFLFGGLSAVASFRLLKQPFSTLAIILGITSLAALTLFAIGEYAGLGAGGMERMILYPILMWGAGFGAYIAGKNKS
jgi:hypothetical membrane protein